MPEVPIFPAVRQSTAVAFLGVSGSDCFVPKKNNVLATFRGFFAHKEGSICTFYQDSSHDFSFSRIRSPPFCWNVRLILT